MMDGAYKLSIAPMMAYTDRHYRYMMRLFTKRSLLYTEMVVGSTLTHNLGSTFLDRVLGFDGVEHPIAVQLGGDDAETLKTSARVCEDYGYDEINLNVGCPSERVQKGRFGACLMLDPDRVAEVVDAMRQVVSIPVTVKHRIGVDEVDDYQSLARFVETVHEKGGADLFIGHARKAWLSGLSPAQNRSVPPLNYEYIYRLKQDFPHLTIIINGGIQSLDEVQTHLQHVDGAMLGRSAYSQPEMFAHADAQIFCEGPSSPLPVDEMLARMNDYAHHQVEQGCRLSFIAKHLVGLFKGTPGARLWRRRITELIQESPDKFDFNDLYKETVTG